MIDVYDHDNGDGFSTADRTVDIFDALNNCTYQGNIDYHPQKITKEDLSSMTRMIDGWICQSCGKGTTETNAVYCPFCGRKIIRDQGGAVDE